MRSRFSAYCYNSPQYIIDTHQSDEAIQLDEIKAIIASTQWLGLKIVASRQGQANDKKGQVEFVAFYQEKSGDKRVKQLHERSQFVKQESQWLYCDGEQMDPIKLSRNDACFCGSGKKYKKCHGVD